MRKITIIQPDGTVSVATVKKAELAYLQKCVGGLIQTLPHFTMYEGRRCVAYVNEEGALPPGLPYNEKATKLWRDALGYNAQTSQNFWYTPSVCGTMVIDQKGEPDVLSSKT